MTRAGVVVLLLALAVWPAAAQSTPATPNSDPPPLRIGPVTLSGYLQADASWVADDDLEESSDTFRIRRARVALGGDIAPKLGWAVSVELSGSPHLRDAHFTVRFAPQFNVRFGQFYPTYGLERLTSSSRLEAIDRTRLTERITYERNPGLMAMNLRPYAGWLSWSVGVFNGPGMNQSDNNDAKDLVARLVLTPPALAGFSIGVNGATGEQPEGDRDRAGIDVAYERGPVKVIVEGLRETMDGVPDRDGFYVLGVYRITPATVTPHFRMAELVARFVEFDDPTAERLATPTRSFMPAVTRELQFGGNYYVNRNTRFMLNAIFPVDDRDTPGPMLIGRLNMLF